jgi:hypothetical protein
LRVSVGLDGSTEQTVTLLPKTQRDRTLAFEGKARVSTLLNDSSEQHGEEGDTDLWSPLGEQELWVTLTPGEEASDLTFRHWIGLEKIDFQGQARTLG